MGTPVTTIKTIFLSGGTAWLFVKAATLTFGLIALSRLVPGRNRFTDRRERYLAATSDEQNAQRHRSLAPNFICFGVETDTGQDPDQG